MNIWYSVYLTARTTINNHLLFLMLLRRVSAPIQYTIFMDIIYKGTRLSQILSKIYVRGVKTGCY